MRLIGLIMLIAMVPSYFYFGLKAIKSFGLIGIVGTYLFGVATLMMIAFPKNFREESGFDWKFVLTYPFALFFASGIAGSFILLVYTVISALFFGGNHGGYQSAEDFFDRP